jgi:mannose-6-phosphate isomerase-like protein (cupin superfamily)
MSSENSTVRNWRDVEPKKVALGVEEFELIVPEETPAKRVCVRLLVIEPESTWKPEKFTGEIFYYFLAGNGILLWHRYNTDLPFLIDNDTTGWIPGTHTYSFENTGEGPMRCLVIFCKTDETYHWRDGSLGKLDALTPISRRVSDTIYSSGVTGARRISGGNYQVLAQGKAKKEHWHDEEVIYIVRGKGKLISSGKEYVLKAGSAAHTPSNIKHRLINIGQDMFGYLGFEFKG